MVSSIFIYVLGAIIVMCLVAQFLTAKIRILNIKGLIYLKNTEVIIAENDDQQELDNLKNVDMPLMIKIMFDLKKINKSIFIAMALNFTLLIFILFPPLYGTVIWGFLIGMVAASNATVIISFKTATVIKHKINAICDGYYLILKSYEHYDEFIKNEDNIDNW